MYSHKLAILFQTPFKMPHTFGAGLTYVYDNRLTIGVDYTLQKWNTADLTWSKFNKEKCGNE